MMHSLVCSVLLLLIPFIACAPKPKIKVIDAVIFDGEPLALYRMLYLARQVDQILLVESLTSRTGMKKTHYLMDSIDDLLKPIASKVTKVHIGELPSGVVNAINTDTNLDCYRCSVYETYIRNSALYTKVQTQFANEKYLLLVGGADDLLNSDSAAFLRSIYRNLRHVVSLEMSSMLYSFQWYIDRPNRLSYALTEVCNSNIGLSQ